MSLGNLGELISAEACNVIFTSQKSKTIQGLHACRTKLPPTGQWRFTGIYSTKSGSEKLWLKTQDPSKRSETCLNGFQVTAPISGRIKSACFTRLLGSTNCQQTPFSSPPKICTKNSFFLSPRGSGGVAKTPTKRINSPP